MLAKAHDAASAFHGIFKAGSEKGIQLVGAEQYLLRATLVFA